MKPGYYIDWANDIMLLYPDGTIDIYSRVFQEYHSEKFDKMLMEGAIFLGDL